MDDNQIQTIVAEISKLKKHEWDRLKDAIDMAYLSEAAKVELSNPDKLASLIKSNL